MENYQPNKFEIASVACGILSLILCCTGVLSIPTGALGILFAVFTKRKGRNLSNMSILGIWISCVGMTLGVILTIYSFYTLFTDPVMFENFNATFKSIYGMGIEEYFGITLNLN